MKKRIRLHRGNGVMGAAAGSAALWLGELNAILGEMLFAVACVARFRASRLGTRAELGAAPQARRGLVETDIT